MDSNVIPDWPNTVIPPSKPTTEELLAQVKISASGQRNVTVKQLELKRQIDVLAENIERRQKRLKELIAQCDDHIWQKLEMDGKLVRICEVCATIKEYYSERRT